MSTFKTENVWVNLKTKKYEYIYKQKSINSIQDYKIYLKNNNLSYEYIKNKITIESLWNEMIFRKFNSRVKIDRDQIKNEIFNWEIAFTMNKNI